jgi:cytosine/adenosine deaminase-related metal-dependent hydrolase
MSDSRLPVEVELVYEVMPCNAMRTAQEPGPDPHPCQYFRSWGTYHSYDYDMDGPPPERGVVHQTRYVGRAPLVPELLSGCRKSPILALGINPNLPGWWPATRRSLNPLFDDYKQYAHYFRYRAVDKLELSLEDYRAFGGGAEDTPFSGLELQVPTDGDGNRTISVILQPQKMYQAYQGLLDSLSEAMGWPTQALVVGEDLAYGNMVHCPSAKWTTQPAPNDPALPPMTVEQRDGIVTECFRKRTYFLRQLFQSLPSVILIFSQNTANAFIAELEDRFSVGGPRLQEPVEQLMKREIRLRYGDLPDGSILDARVVFAPHITGDPAHFAAARKQVVEQLVEEARAGGLRFDDRTRHLTRPMGACVFCPMLEIGPCDYKDELRPLTNPPRLTAESPVALLQAEKRAQSELMAGIVAGSHPVHEAWAATDDPDPNDPSGSGGETSGFAPGSGSQSAVATRAPVFTRGKAGTPLEVSTLAASPVDEDRGPTFVLRGRVVTMARPGEVIADGRVVVSQGKIAAVLRAGEDLPEPFTAAPEVVTAGTIYPGLIDLHTHLAYNALPLWRVPRAYQERKAWQDSPAYKSQVQLPGRVLAGYAKTARALVRYVETKAIIGGTTTAQGLRTKVEGGSSLFHGALRNVEITGDSRLPEAGTLVPTMRTDPQGVARFRDRLAALSASGGSYFYHLSEGLNDNAHRTFADLQNFDLLHAPLVGIHCLALAPEDLRKASDAGVPVVWSPFSNLLLYGRTLNLAALEASSARFSIGSDWSPTGSKNLLEELKVARFEARRQAAHITSEDLVRAVTAAAAEIVGWQRHLGTIAVGMLADLLVVSGSDGDPFDHLIDARERDVRLVTIHGAARYGDPGMMRLLTDPSRPPERCAVDGRPMAVDVATPSSPLADLTFASARAILTDAVADLRATRQQALSDGARLTAMGWDAQPFLVELDNEPVETQEDEQTDPLEATLAADWDRMVDHTDLDAPEVDGAAYWDRLMDQANLSAELKETLLNAYRG